MASTIDDSFEYKCSLEIYRLSPSPSLSAEGDSSRGGGGGALLVGGLSTRDTFHSVAWGSKGIAEASSLSATSSAPSALSTGLIAGGMSDGTLNLWSASHIFKTSHPGQFAGGSPSTHPALLVRADGQHKGAINALQFHPSQPNLLASGAADGVLLVWDLADVRSPKSSTPNALAGSVVEHSLTCLGWNRNVPHILATANEAGETTVWDLRAKKSLVKFRSSARTTVRATGLVWNPEAKVELALSYANHSVVEIWDLRQAMTPKVKLEGFHTGSILGLDWNPHDAHLMITSGEDQKLGVWDPIAGHLLQEFEPGVASNIYDVTWSPHLKGLFATCSYDQHSRVSVHALPKAGDHVPSWLKKMPVPSLAFGGRCAQVLSSSSAAEDPKSLKNTAISLGILSFEPQLVSLASQFMDVLAQGDLHSFCARKATESANEEDHLTWAFMKILLEDPAVHRGLILRELGFQPPPDLNLNANADGISNAVGSAFLSSSVSPAHHNRIASQHSLAAANSVQPPVISEDQFFGTFDDSVPLNPHSPVALDQEHEHEHDVNVNGLVSPLHNAHTIKAESEQNGVSSHGNGVVDLKSKVLADPEHAYLAFKETDEDEALIRSALLYGDFAQAVQRCLSSGRLADAIVFSSFGPPALWEETRASFFATHGHPFIKKSMSLVSTGELEELVETSGLDVDDWKQTLALLLTYSNGDRYRSLVNALGERLYRASHALGALICFICCQNVDRAVELFSRSHSHANEDHLTSLHASIEKIVLFAHITQAHTLQPPSAMLAEKVSEYASMLASQSAFALAWNFLLRANPLGNDPATVILLDRLFHVSHEPIQAQQPPFPFAVQRIQPDPALLAHQGEYEQQKRARAALVQATMTSHHAVTTSIAAGVVSPQSQPQVTAPQSAAVRGPAMHPQQQQQRPSTNYLPPPQQQQQAPNNYYNPPPPGQVTQPRPAAAPYSNPNYPFPSQSQHQHQIQSQVQPSMQMPSYQQAPSSPFPAQPQMQQAYHQAHPQPQVPHHQQQPPQSPALVPNPYATHSLQQQQTSASNPSQVQGDVYGAQRMPPPPAHAQIPQVQTQQQVHPQAQPHIQGQGQPLSTLPTDYASGPQRNVVLHPHQQPPPPQSQAQSAYPPFPSQIPAQPHQPDLLPSIPQSQRLPHLSAMPAPSIQQQQQQQQQTVSQTPQPARSFSSQASSMTPAPAASFVPSSTPVPAPMDMSSFVVAPEMNIVFATLENKVMALRGRVSGVELKKLNDSHSKLASLYAKLAPGSIASLRESLVSSLTSLCMCVNQGDYANAIKVNHMALVKNDWTGNNDWILALKTLVEMSKKYAV